MKVWLSNYEDIITVEKEAKGPKRRGFIKTWIWGEDPADKMERTRFIVMQEGKITTLK
jgi:hypothetical protein